MSESKTSEKELVYLVTEVGDGHFSVNFNWLPTWLGTAASVQIDIEEVLSKYKGRYVDKKLMEEMHEDVAKYIALKYQAIDGLEDYLRALSKVKL